MAASERPWWFPFTRLARMAGRDGFWRPSPGLTPPQVVEAKAVFAHMGVTLPDGLLDLYKETAQFGCVTGPDEFFGSVHLGGATITLWDRNRRWRDTGVFRVADIGSAALCCDGKGAWAVAPYVPADLPSDFRLEIDEALTLFLQAMIREYGSGKAVLATA